MTLQTVDCDAMGPFKTRKKLAKSASARSGKVGNAYAAEADYPSLCKKAVLMVHITA